MQSCKCVWKFCRHQPVNPNTLRSHNQRLSIRKLWNRSFNRRMTNLYWVVLFRCRHIITNFIVCNRYPIAIVQCLICCIQTVNSYKSYFWMWFTHWKFRNVSFWIFKHFFWPAGFSMRKIHFVVFPIYIVFINSSIVHYVRDSGRHFLIFKWSECEQ